MVESHTAEAVLFFENGVITKEMTYEELQAILDNYIPMQELAGKTLRVAYVRINSQFIPTAAVFFKLPFDSKGYVEKHWNIPFQHMADIASKGPNLGAGPITLACASQCPIEWHQKSLWDPSMEATHNDFANIKKSLKNNSLGIIFNVPSEQDDGAARPEEDRTHAAMLIREQRLKHRLLLSQAKQELRKVNLEHQERTLNLQQHIESLQKDLEAERIENARSQERISGLEDKISGIRDYYDAKLRQAEESDNIDIDAIHEHYESQLKAQIDAITTDLETKIKTKEVELVYRADRENQLLSEIKNLQNQVTHSVDAVDINQFITKMDDAGFTFVVYHPGAGHITVGASEIQGYLANPVSHVAKYCGVNEQIYSLWLDHYYSPTCQHELANGDICDMPINRLEDPSEFIVGESDRCNQHKNQSSSVVNLGRSNRPAVN